MTEYEVDLISSSWLDCCFPEAKSFERCLSLETIPHVTMPYCPVVCLVGLFHEHLIIDNEREMTRIIDLKEHMKVSLL